MKNESTKDTVGRELENTRSRFHETLTTLSREEWHKKSFFPEWTNGQVLFHVMLGFMILPLLINLILFWDRLPASFSRMFAGLLNFMTRPFIRADILGPRFGAKVFSYESIGRKFDKVHASVFRKLNSLKEDDWQRGMYYPTRWDPLIKEYMKVEDLFHYMTKHLDYHLRQISRQDKTHTGIQQ